MGLRHFAGAAIAACTISLLAMGCSTTTDDLGNSEAAATPPNPSGAYGMAESCYRNMKRHASVRPLDMQQGLIRWGCGDVPGVTNDDLGQEYCEYSLVQNGAIKKKATELAAGQKAACVFTAVFTGANQETMLKTEMAKPENLGVSTIATGVSQMRKGFNSRGAATQLFSDCTRAGTSATSLTGRLRAAACYTEFAKGGDNAAQLATACKLPLTTEANWTQVQALGVKLAENGDPDFEMQHDIAGCMAVTSAGLPWRNSDPMICSRVARSAQECGCKWNPVPADLMGIPFTGWVDDQIPPGCRLAKVSGGDYPFVAICDVSDQELADMPLNPLYAGHMGNFCHDRFGVDLVMKLPIRALQQDGSCSETPGFCDEYMGDPEPKPEPTEPTEPTTTEPTGPGRTTGPTPPTPPPAAN